MSAHFLKLDMFILRTFLEEIIQATLFDVFKTI